MWERKVKGPVKDLDTAVMDLIVVGSIYGNRGMGLVFDDDFIETVYKQNIRVRNQISMFSRDNGFSKKFTFDCM